MPASTPTAEREWISARAVLRTLPIGPRSLSKLVDEGFIATLKIPGTYRRYRRSDVERLAAASVELTAALLVRSTRTEREKSE